jgi:hypothetical protein
VKKNKDFWRWDGAITSLNRESFTCSLVGEKPEDLPDIVTEYSYDKVREIDKPFLTIGAPISIYLRLENKIATKYVLRFRKARWTKKELEKAYERAEKLAEELRWN